MALLKSESTNWGVDVTYWNIYSINEDYKSKTLDVVLAGYISKETRDKELAPVTSKSFMLNGKDYIADADREAVYKAIKLLKDFDKSKDV
jgi:hypothetical protein